MSGTAGSKPQAKQNKVSSVVEDCGQWDEKEHKVNFVLFIFNLTCKYLGISEVPGAVWFTDLQGYGWRVKRSFFVYRQFHFEYVFDASMLLLCSHFIHVIYTTNRIIFR